MTEQSETIPAPETVAFHFDRPKAGAQPDADGMLPTEEVTLEIPLSKIAPLPPPLDLSRYPDAAVLKLYQLALKLPEQTEADILRAEIMRRNLDV